MRIELEVDDALVERVRICMSGQHVQALIVRTLERECAKVEKRMSKALDGTIRFYEEPHDRTDDHRTGYSVDDRS